MNKLKAILFLHAVLIAPICKAESPRPDIRWTTNLAGVVKACSISSDAKMIAAGTEDGKVIIFEGATGRVLKQIDAHTQRVNQVAFSPDNTLAASTSNDNGLKIWKVADGSLARAFTHSAFLCPVVFGLDSKVVFAGGGGGFIRAWNVETGTTVRTFTGETTSIWALDLSTDGTRLVSGSGAPNNRVRLWNATAGSSIRSMTGHTADVRGVRFSASGANIVSASADKTVKSWETETGRSRTLREATAELYSVAFSRDSQQIVAGSGGTENALRFWRSSGDFAVLKTYTEAVAGVNTLHFSAGGSSFVYVTESGDVTYAWNPFVAPLTIGATTISEGNLNLSWIGGAGPFQTQARINLDVPWQNIGPALSVPQTMVPVSGEMMYVRVLAAE